MDVRVRCRRRVAATTSSSGNRSERKASEQLGCAWRPGEFHGDGNEHN